MLTEVKLLLFLRKHIEYVFQFKGKNDDKIHSYAVPVMHLTTDL